MYSVSYTPTPSFSSVCSKNSRMVQGSESAGFWYVCEVWGFGLRMLCNSIHAFPSTKLPAGQYRDWAQGSRSLDFECWVAGIWAFSLCTLAFFEGATSLTIPERVALPNAPDACSALSSWGKGLGVRAWGR